MQVYRPPVSHRESAIFPTTRKSSTDCALTCFVQISMLAYVNRLHRRVCHPLDHAHVKSYKYSRFVPRVCCRKTISPLELRRDPRVINRFTDRVWEQQRGEGETRTSHLERNNTDTRWMRRQYAQKPCVFPLARELEEPFPIVTDISWRFDPFASLPPGVSWAWHPGLDCSLTSEERMFRHEMMAIERAARERRKQAEKEARKRAQEEWDRELASGHRRIAPLPARARNQAMVA